MVTAFLNKPYPYFKNLKKDLLSYAGIGLFVAGFLIIFQPFDINQWSDPDKNIKLFGFGCISFIVPTVFTLLIRKIIPAKTTEESWTVYKEILIILGILICIALGNLAYGRFLHIMPANASAWLMAFTCTVLVGIFPVSAHVILKHNRFLKLNLQQTIHLNQQIREHEAHHLNEFKSVEAQEAKPMTLRFVAENEKDVFSITSEQLIFVESADNYSNIVYIENGNRKRELFRSSLKKMESQLPDKTIIRCHRAYIVNLTKIKNVEGNAAGYKLFFNDTSDCVPVSRSYVAAFNEQLNALK